MVSSPGILSSLLLEKSRWERKGWCRHNLGEAGESVVLLM